MEDLKWVSSLPRKTRVAMYGKAMARLVDKIMTPWMVFSMSIWACMGAISMELSVLGWTDADTYPKIQLAFAAAMGWMWTTHPMHKQIRRGSVGLSCALTFAVMAGALSWANPMEDIYKQRAKTAVEDAKSVADNKEYARTMNNLNAHTLILDRETIDFWKNQAADWRGKADGFPSGGELWRQCMRHWVNSQREVAEGQARLAADKAGFEADKKKRSEDGKKLEKELAQSRAKSMERDREFLGVTLQLYMMFVSGASLIMAALLGALILWPVNPTLKLSWACVKECGAFLAKPIVFVGKASRELLWAGPKKLALATPGAMKWAWSAVSSAGKNAPQASVAQAKRLRSWSASGMAALLVPDAAERAKLERQAMEGEAGFAPERSGEAKAKRRL